MTSSKRSTQGRGSYPVRWHQPKCGGLRITFSFSARRGRPTRLSPVPRIDHGSRAGPDLAAVRRPFPPDASRRATKSSTTVSVNDAGRRVAFVSACVAARSLSSEAASGYAPLNGESVILGAHSDAKDARAPTSQATYAVPERGWPASRQRWPRPGLRRLAALTGLTARRRRHAPL